MPLPISPTSATVSHAGRDGNAASATDTRVPVAQACGSSPRSTLEAARASAELSQCRSLQRRPVAVWMEERSVIAEAVPRNAKAGWDDVSCEEAGQHVAQVAEREEVVQAGAGGDDVDRLAPEGRAVLSHMPRGRWSSMSLRGHAMDAP